jgi:hypothetical protein
VHLAHLPIESAAKYDVTPSVLPPVGAGLSKPA